LDGTRQILVYADDVNVLGVNINTTRRTQAVLQATGNVCLDVGTEKTKYDISLPKCRADEQLTDY
jgi:hypothetical protein